MITLSDISGLPPPEQLFSYASAYRDASAASCQRMISDTASSTWPNATVVLMLAVHAVELFLKAALLKRNVAPWEFGHNLDRLSEEYRKQFVDPLFEWDIPFARSLSEDEWVALMMRLNPQTTEDNLRKMKAAVPAFSIIYRYPVDKGGNEWKVVHGFEPHTFLQALSQLECDFHRIKSQLI